MEAVLEVGTVESSFEFLGLPGDALLVRHDFLASIWPEAVVII